MGTAAIAILQLTRLGACKKMIAISKLQLCNQGSLIDVYLLTPQCEQWLSCQITENIPHVQTYLSHADR